MRTDQQWIDLLSTMALDLPRDIRGSKFLLTSAVVQKGQALSFGFNQRKSHPLQARFGKNDESIFLHSEIDAMRNAIARHGKQALRNSVLYVARMKYDLKNKMWIHGLACPCEGCWRAVKEFGIKRVVYTTNDRALCAV